jgi:hypothetical protein
MSSALKMASQDGLKLLKNQNTHKPQKQSLSVKVDIHHFSLFVKFSICAIGTAAPWTKRLSSGFLQILSDLVGIFFSHCRDAPYDFF